MYFEEFKNIKNSDTWIEIIPLNKGWSNDKKYIIIDKYNQKHLLRLSDISLLDKKQKQFELLKKVEELNINASKPIDFGILNNKTIYMLLTWLEGEDATSVISSLSNEKAYELGIEAGKILQKLHDIPVTNIDESWWSKYQKKVERKIIELNNCKLDIPNKELFINYLNNNIYLVKDRPRKFSHGDYHMGNMIVNNGILGIIDFDKNNIEDPYDEFKPFCWNVFCSEYFETGLINGYFNEQIPDDFFPILALYAAESIIGLLPWSIEFGTEEIEVAYNVMNSIMKWYDNFNIVVPSWYKGIL